MDKRLNKFGTVIHCN